MNENNNGVEANLGQPAPADNTAVETTIENPAADTQVEAKPSVTLEEYNALQERLTKIEAEKDNYKKGLLQAKGKLPEDEPYFDESPTVTPETIAEIVRKELAAKELDQEHANLLKQKEDLLQKVLRENEELRLATIAKSKAGQTPSSGGVSLKPETSASFWSPEQEAAIRAKGLDPEVVRQNFMKQGGTK